MADLHALLRRQLRKRLGGTDVPEAMKAFVAQVNEAYLQADDERRMLERAFDLSSQELMDANEELAEASRAKDRFLAMLGHELRNPLAPIVMALEVAALRSSSSVDVRDLERPVRQVLRLVDDLLDIARVARGTLVLEKRPFEVSRSVRDAVEAIQPTAAQAGLRAAHRRAAVRADGRRRRGAADPGREQPAGQRRPPHRTGRRHPGPRRTRGGRRRAERVGQRAGNRPRAACRRSSTRS